MSFMKRIPAIAPQIIQLGAVMLVASAGLIFALTGGIQGFEHSPLYLYIATGLLCFGLYMAGYGIDLQEARRHWRIVAVAITVGVLAKYAIIAGVTYLATGDWRYVVVGMAVAQIDPLSVAALNNDSRMSAKTRTVLNMWASFDDPMTALITPVLLGVVANAGHQQFIAGQGVGEILIEMAPFILLIIAMAFMVLWRRRGWSNRLQRSELHARLKEDLKRHESEGPKTVAVQSVLLVSTALHNPPAPALFSLICRPKWLDGPFGALLTSTALYGATFLLGVLLANGVDWKGGLVLGFATYGSQMVVAWGVVWLSMWLTPGEKAEHRFSPREVWHLALAQQNGITAIVLALVLQPAIPIAVASVSLAIVIVNLTQFLANWVFDKIIEPAVWREDVIAASEIKKSESN